MQHAVANNCRSSIACLRHGRAREPLVPTADLACQLHDARCTVVHTEDICAACPTEGIVSVGDAQVEFRDIMPKRRDDGIPKLHVASCRSGAGQCALTMSPAAADRAASTTFSRSRRMPTSRKRLPAFTASSSPPAAGASSQAVSRAPE